MLTKNTKQFRYSRKVRTTLRMLLLLGACSYLYMLFKLFTYVIEVPLRQDAPKEYYGIFRQDARDFLMPVSSEYPKNENARTQFVWGDKYNIFVFSVDCDDTTYCDSLLNSIHCTETRRLTNGFMKTSSDYIGYEIYKSIPDEKLKNKGLYVELNAAAAPLRPVSIGSKCFYSFKFQEINIRFSKEGNNEIVIRASGRPVSCNMLLMKKTRRAYFVFMAPREGGQFQAQDSLSSLID